MATHYIRNGISNMKFIIKSQIKLGKFKKKRTIYIYYITSFTRNRIVIILIFKLMTNINYFTIETFINYYWKKKINKNTNINTTINNNKNEKYIFKK